MASEGSMDGESTISPLNLFQDSSNKKSRDFGVFSYVQTGFAVFQFVLSLGITGEILVVFTPSQQEFIHTHIPSSLLFPVSASSYTRDAPVPLPDSLQ